MNLSLILVLLLIAVVIPWMLRRFFPRQPGREGAQWLEPAMETTRDAYEDDYEIIKKTSSAAPLSYALDVTTEQSIILPEKTPAPAPQEKKSIQKDLLVESNLRVIYVMAPKGEFFIGYELLQALQNAGLRYGARQIFHCYTDESDKTTLAFSVASAVEPGSIDMQEIGMYATPGLSLFMDASSVDSPELSYQWMKETAEQLADELGGVVRYDTK